MAPALDSLYGATQLRQKPFAAVMLNFLDTALERVKIRNVWIASSVVRLRDSTTQR